MGTGGEHLLGGEGGGAAVERSLVQLPGGRGLAPCTKHVFICMGIVHMIPVTACERSFCCLAVSHEPVVSPAARHTRHTQHKQRNVAAASNGRVLARMHWWCQHMGAE